MNRELATRGEPTPLRDFISTLPSPSAADLAGLRLTGAAALGRGDAEVAGVIAGWLDLRDRVGGQVPEPDGPFISGEVVTAAIESSIALGASIVAVSQQIGEADNNQ